MKIHSEIIYKDQILSWPFESEKARLTLIESVMIYKDCNYCNYNIIWSGDFNYSSKSGGLDKIKILSTTSNIYWKYCCINNPKYITIAKLSQAPVYLGWVAISAKLECWAKFDYSIVFNSKIRNSIALKNWIRGQLYFSPPPYMIA